MKNKHVMTNSQAYKNDFCIRQIKKIVKVFIYPNISHELITSKTCQLYLKSYQFFSFVDLFFKYPKTYLQN